MTAPLLEAVALEVPRAIAGVFGDENLRPARCILATRVGVQVLARFDVAAKPVAVEAYVMNGAWLAWLEAGNPDPRPADGYSIFVGKRDPGDLDANGFDGHVIVATSTALVDCDFRAFDRPAKGMPAPDGIVLAMATERFARFYAGERVGFATDEGPSLALSLQYTGRTDFLDAPDWRRPHREAVRHAYKAVRRRLEEIAR